MITEHHTSGYTNVIRYYMPPTLVINFKTNQQMLLLMKKIIFTLALTASMATSTFAQQDTEGTKDHPMFPGKMTNYYRSESTTNFDAVDFNLATGGSKMINKEGTKSYIRYDFNTESGQSKPSALQILRNYEAAAKKTWW